MSCGWRWLVLDEERVMEAVLLFLIVKYIEEVFGDSLVVNRELLTSSVLIVIPVGFIL